MLVTFRCTAYADITMFGEVAVALLKLMGHSGTVPGALAAADVHAALARLRDAIETAGDAPGPKSGAEEAEEKPVSLKNRALPLIEMLEAAGRAESYVLWDANT